MKIVCNVFVGNRLLPALAMSAKKKHVKSTLALCKHPKNDEYSIILFTNQNKNGTKYNTKGNISQILTRFISEGKATIQFKAPPHDLFVNGDVIQLKGFLHLLKRILENTITPKEMSHSSLTVTHVSSQNVPPKKMVIQARSEYPSKGFPRSLESLYINGIRRCGLDRGILQLSKLKILDLSSNCIEFIPEELNTLPNLNELNLGSNHLHKSRVQQWSWMSGRLSQTLFLLNLELNRLKTVPCQIVQLHRLETLNLNSNELAALPTGIGHLRNLKTLIASNNLLSILPGSIKSCRFQVLNLFHNKFQRLNNNFGVSQKRLSVCTLVELASREVLHLRLPYSSSIIPFTLVHTLDHANYCVCGNACFDVFIRAVDMFLIGNIAQSVIKSSNEDSFLPIDCFFCTLKCFQSFYSGRNRQPVVR